MKTWRLLLVVVLLAGLALNLAACGGEEAQPEEPTATEATAGETVSEIEPTKVEEEQPTQAPTEEPTQEPTEAATEAVEPEPTEEGLDLSLLGTTADFTSYRSRMSMVIAGMQAGEPVEQTIEMTMEETTDPPAQHVSMSGSMIGAEAGADSIEMYTVGDTMYMKLGDTWMAVPADEENAIEGEIFTPDTFMGDSCGWSREADTEVMGVRVHHYSVDKDSIDACATSEMLDELGTINEFQGDLYVAVDGEYLVQMDMHYEGENLAWDIGVESEEKLEEASFDIHFEYTDVNVPFTIEVPEEALAAAGMPEDIPLPAESGAVSNAFGFITFETSLTGEEVYNFYLAEMPNNGWTQESAEAMGTLYMMEFSKDARSVSFMITTDDDTGQTSVLITVTEE